MTTWCPDENVLISDSEDEEVESRFKGREAMLFVLDAYLFKTPERFVEALDIIRNAFISGMIVNDKELMGLVFMNTDLSPEPYEPNCLDDIVVPPNCAVFLPLRQLSKAIVEHFLRFQITAPEMFSKDYGISAHDASFASLIRLCLNLFDRSTYSLREAKIVFLTDKTTPHSPQTHEYQMALQKARDLEGRLVEFYVIPMIDDFDYEPFYKEFLSLAKDVEIDSFVVPDAKQQREILTERKLKQDFKKRCLGHFNFVLGPKLELSVQYYNYFQKRSFPRKIKMLRKDNTLVQRKFVMTVSKEDPQTQEEIEKRDLKMTDGWYEMNLGGLPIRISMERMDRVRNIYGPQMMLLGFKPISALPHNLYYKPCNFMYPDDENIVGSKRLFRALWERCLERSKMAICLFMRKRKSKPRYVALLPISTKEREYGESHAHSLLIGDGFKIVYLPFEKQIRCLDFRDWNSIENTASEEGVQVFEKIVRKLKINYKPEMIGDPVLDKLQSKLVRLALDIETQYTDCIELASAELQDERIKKLLPEYHSHFGDDPETVGPKRRPDNDAAAGGNAAKIPKLSQDDLNDLKKVKELIDANSLNSCTKDQLVLILDKHFDLRLPKSTTKKVLIEKIVSLKDY